ncbi:MAG: putative acetyltransferase [Paraglaciecola sp.]|jgi:putative acetyltransferase
MACAEDYTIGQLEVWAPQTYDQKKCAERMQGIRPFVARLDGKIVGYTNLQLNGYIDHFFVHGEYQGRGVGAALMSTILRKDADLETLHSKVNITAKAFFIRYGCEVLDAQDVWIRKVKLQNYFMQYRNKK